MKKRMFVIFTSTICSALLAFFLISMIIVYRENINFAKNTVMNYTDIYKELYEVGADIDILTDSGKPLRDDVRLTIIDSDGTVLRDSKPLDTTMLDNHLGREEVQAALAGEPRVVIRYSATLGRNMMYYAQKAMSSDGDGYVFVRMATPIDAINSYALKSLPILIITLILIIGVAFYYANKASGVLMTPFSHVKASLQSINEGTYRKIALHTRYDEIDQITTEIDDIALKLEQNISGLRSEKDKLDYILNNINDALFAVDSNLNIVLVNARAKWIFESTGNLIGHPLSYLTFDNPLTESIEDCVRSNQGALLEFELKGNIYLVTVKNLHDKTATDAALGLCIVVLSDITENKRNQKMREEFFANASHELKTPLTAIKGFNELTAINNKDPEQDKFISQISKETDRMLSLIGDMLRLSELENTRQLSPEPVELLKSVNEAVVSLETIINDKRIDIAINGQGIVMAEPGHIYELTKNLIENAVRYNVQDGKVYVNIKDTGDSIVLKVSDTGVGISASDQSRIFERFYRAEKGRSRLSGGTGLGLSIVKHVCNLYDAKITLRSKPGSGTEIEVVFRKS